jgi:hypothetical protein
MSNHRQIYFVRQRNETFFTYHSFFLFEIVIFFDVFRSIRTNLNQRFFFVTKKLHIDDRLTFLKRFVFLNVERKHDDR